MKPSVKDASSADWLLKKSNLGESQLNVYFCGMIGTGKTTIGLELADELGVEFLDLDREMDSRLGYSFHQLVAEKGWLAFRELEYSICRDFAKKKNSIICLGGGTVRYDWKRRCPETFRKTDPAGIVHRRAGQPRLQGGQTPGERGRQPGGRSPDHVRTVSRQVPRCCRYDLPDG